MKAITHKTYEKRIEILKEHIKNNMYEPEKLRLQKLAMMACICTAHLQRIYRVITGETLNGYVLRLRMESAAKMILDKEMLICEVGDKLGYADKNSFRKSFKSYYGIPPSKFNEEVLAINNYKPLKTVEMKLKENIVELKPISVIYTRVKGNYEKQRPEEAWERIWDFVDKNKIEVENAEFFGIVHDNTEITEPENCRYDACISMGKQVKVEPGISTTKLKGGKYAVFTHKGPYSKLDETYKQIFVEWCSSCDYEISEEPILEKYLNDPEDVKPEELITEIYIPLQ